MLLCLLLTALPADGGFDAADPSSWRLSARLTPEARAQLVSEFTKGGGGGVGEKPLTVEEANALLDDPRAELVYGEKTISIVAPSMIQRQRKDHLDLMAMFLKPERLEAGAKFARDNEALLSKVEAKTHVDREVIIGILMWESKLGTITGEYKAFNAFTSQIFFIDDASAVAMSRKEEKKLMDAESQKKRADTIRERARKNLTALVRQCKAKGMDTLEVKGSWAGALGFPQFMPASLRWAEDGDGDGKIDLFTMPDSVASVGRYLSEHGFQKDHRKAVWDYNHEDAYVQGVLAFGEKLHALLSGKSAGASPDGGT
ncbi:MAG: lytic murein transglycosylase [Archangiaceae bacterium]|nr:lytic murein transglycosylase [Archangiaceae bacterium]